MKLNKVNHIAVIASDIEQSIAFLSMTSKLA